ncbi:MAG: insulinase family protein [Lachnospiraceae bacterium]|nr:insulinase family protein [Lachnospiraceae bacterium]
MGKSKIGAPAAYRLVGQKEINEVHSVGSVWEHVKTGARILTMENDDDNKVFSIAFRTPPADHTGVAHILEHSVLCGSAKFPVKDPFVELVKGSLNTFLNAMTYPDKTVYPVASTNAKDFRNLMDVYLDSVFHPNILHEEKIFRQEGWHHEMEDTSGPITLNGVVYNEMKGAFSSPESVLERQTLKMLYPDVCYGFESGGDPDYIPDLTYEAFLDFHGAYYHPSNSFIYLYGDMDMTETLEWLDGEYLCTFERREVPSQIAMQTPFVSPVESYAKYAITESEPMEKATYLSSNYVVGTNLDPVHYIAFQILEYALLDAPGAPLKQALLDAGIGEDIMGGYGNGILQPYFSVVAKNADEGQRGEFLAVIEGTLRKLCDGGLSEKSLLAGLNIYEFRYREADFGYPKGLVYGLQCLDSWLYDADPFMHLEYGSVFAKLRGAVKEKYFEGLIEEWFLDNGFRGVLTLSPERGLTGRKEAEVAGKLALYLAGLSEEEREGVVRRTRELRRYQEEPSTKEDLEKIPMLSRGDLGTEAEKPIWEEMEIDGVKVVRHDVFTSGIGYLKVLFDTSRVPQEDLPYVGLLGAVLGYVDTERHGYADLASEIDLNSGGMHFSIAAYGDASAGNQAAASPGGAALWDTGGGGEMPVAQHRAAHAQTGGAQTGGARTIGAQTSGAQTSGAQTDGGNAGFTGMFTGSIKVLYDKLGFGFDILAEVLTASKFDDEKRLTEILLETKSRTKMWLDGASHSAAAGRAQSYISPMSLYADMTGGIGYYRFLEDVAGKFAGGKDCAAARREIIRKLKETASRLFGADNLLISFTADDAGFEALPGAMKGLVGALPDKGTGDPAPFSFREEKRNEAFMTASQVNYLARVGNFRHAGLEYTGVLRVLKVILGYDYLWQNVRVTGGAYGCMCGFGRTGESYMVSYRDPHVGRTNEIYEAAAGYVAQFAADEREMTKYVIGAVSELDRPQSPAVKGSRGLSYYLSHVDGEMLSAERAQVLGASAEDVRGLAAYLRALLDAGCICAIGNEEKIEADKDLFGKVLNLY